MKMSVWQTQYLFSRDSQQWTCSRTCLAGGGQDVLSGRLDHQSWEPFVSSPPSCTRCVDALAASGAGEAAAWHHSDELNGQHRSCWVMAKPQQSSDIAGNRLANRVIMTASMSEHNFKSDVGTTSSGDDTWLASSQVVAELQRWLQGGSRRAAVHCAAWLRWRLLMTTSDLLLLCCWCAAVYSQLAYRHVWIITKISCATRHNYIQLIQL